MKRGSGGWRLVRRGKGFYGLISLRGIWREGNCAIECWCHDVLRLSSVDGL